MAIKVVVKGSAAETTPGAWDTSEHKQDKPEDHAGGWLDFCGTVIASKMSGSINCYKVRREYATQHANHALESMERRGQH